MKADCEIFIHMFGAPTLKDRRKMTSMKGVSQSKFKITWIGQMGATYCLLLGIESHPTFLCFSQYQRVQKLANCITKTHLQKRKLAGFDLWIRSKKKGDIIMLLVWAGAVDGSVGTRTISSSWEGGSRVAPVWCQSECHQQLPLAQCPGQADGLHPS